MLCINQKTGPLQTAVEKAELRRVKKLYTICESLNARNV